MTVAPARPDDYATVGELCVEAYRRACVLVDAYAPRLRDVERRAQDAEVLVARDGGDWLLGTVTFVLGGALREIATPGEAEFRMLAVDPAAAGRGIGTTLVRACASRARAAGRARLVCSSQPDMAASHAVYRRLRFVRDAERDWSPIPGVDLLAFALTL